MRRLAPVLLFLAVFVPTSLLMGALVPWPSEYGVRSKWEYWQAHKTEFDAVFVGSSATSYGLIPPDIDRELAARGHELRTFNLGIGGMTEFEADHMVRAVLDEAPPNLKYLLIEVSGWGARVYGGKQAHLSPRLLYWHTPEMTLDALRACFRGDRPDAGAWYLEPLPLLWNAFLANFVVAGEAGPEAEGTAGAWNRFLAGLRLPVRSDEDWRLASARLHAELCLHELTGKGQGARIVSGLLGLDAAEVLPTAAELRREGGYIDLDHIEGDEWQAWRAEFLGDLEGYTQRVRAITAANEQPIPVEGHSAAYWFTKQVEAARAKGVEPIFYFGPRTASSPLAYRLAEAGVLPTFFGFNRPERYPALYRFENHFDENHLTRSGAEIFSKLLADALADHLDAERKE
ncbi:MAG: hypothetical protein H6828_03820 [Planctomycetes bacterium]|nr:hypothetical protein [Planctomycetota bacterium]